MERNNFFDSSLGLVAELVRWHLPARSLVRFKLVCKEWCSQNLSELVKLRTASRNWYFPISFSKAASVPGVVRTWSAIHHASDKDHAEDQHRLPDLDFLPNWHGLHHEPGHRHFLVHPVNCYSIEAACGGLLLFSCKSPHGGSLYVVNPLTKGWRCLSYRDCCEDLGNGDGNLIHAYVVVDRDSRKYTIVVLAKCCVNVYCSQSQSWTCNPVVYSFSGVRRLGESHRYTFPGSACANGSVFICSRFSTAANNSDETQRYQAVIKIQIIPIEHGEGRRPAHTAMSVDDFRAHDCFLGSGEPCAPPKLVECLGNIYVVALTCDAYYSSGAPAVFMMRREFHIFRFRAAENTVLKPFHVRHVVESTLSGRPLLSRLWVRREHFSCTAMSGVIWLAWEKFLLQYDVVSNVWKSNGCHSSDSPLDEDVSSCLAYTPSFDISP